MNMNHSTSMHGPPSFPPGYPPCALYGNGTIRYGHYKPTSAESAYCQNANEPWASNVRFALYTCYFFAATTVMFIIARIVKRDRALRSLCAKPLAFARLVTYPVLSTWLPPLGNSLLIFAFAIFSFGFTFGNRVYSRPPNFGSWPIGLRSEWIATAMLPWIYQLPTKRNILSCLTAMSHEKMQVVHQYGGWILFILSLVHTIGLQLRAMRQEPWSYTWSTNSSYSTGYEALAPLAILCIFSLPQLRRKWYEAFFVIHFLAAAFFLWLMCNHVMRALGSQYYCYAAIAVWSAALLWRHGAVLFGLARHMARGRGLPRATFEMMPGGLIRVVLRTSMSWQPGQHIFLRVLDCRPAETHPFTIASLPRRAGAAGQDVERGALSDDGLNELVLLIRPSDGFTSSLTKVIMANSSNGQSAVALPVLVDGPYGEAAHLQNFDSVLLIAGGTGVSFVLPIFHDVIYATADASSCSRLSLMWAARDTAIFKQFERELSATLANASSRLQVDVTTFATNGPLGDTGESSDEKSMEETPLEGKRKDIVSLGGRPDVSHAIAAAALAVGSGRLAVAACGPSALIRDVRNVVAQCQRDILSRKIAAKEVALESAVFGW